MKEIPIYNKATLNINKEMLDYLTRIVEEHCGELGDDDTEEHKEMVKDLYSILVVKCSKFSAEEIAEEKIFNKSFEVKDEDKLKQ